MKKHLDISEREKHRCEEDNCTFESVSKTSLRAHKRLEHMGKKANGQTYPKHPRENKFFTGQKKTFMCHCGKVFTQNSSYYTHVKIVHEKLKKHPCKLCSKAFFEKNQLKNHIKSQHVSIYLQCQPNFSYISYIFSLNRGICHAKSARKCSQQRSIFNPT